MKWLWFKLSPQPYIHAKIKMLYILFSFLHTHGTLFSLCPLHVIKIRGKQKIDKKKREGRGSCQRSQMKMTREGVEKKALKLLYKSPPATPHRPFNPKWLTGLEIGQTLGYFSLRLRFIKKVFWFNHSFYENLKNPKWPTGGPKIADRVWKGYTLRFQGGR